MLAWDDSGKGFVMQVSTPSWPGSGSEKRPRKNDGNTLGCVKNYAHRDQPCSSSQNGRGGMFFVLQNRRLRESVTKLLAGKSAPMKSPKTKGDAG